MLTLAPWWSLPYSDPQLLVRDDLNWPLTYTLVVDRARSHDGHDVTIRCAQCNRVLGWLYEHWSPVISETALRSYQATGNDRWLLTACGVMPKRADTITASGGPRFRLKCNGKRCNYERVVTAKTLDERANRALAAGSSWIKFD